MRLYETEETAIKVAKQRAKSEYRTQYVFAIGSDFYVRSSLMRGKAPIIKVTYAGEVTKYPEMREKLNQG